MCLATPVKLIKINDDRGTVENNGQSYSVKLDLIDNPCVGDWLLCHADLAVNRLSESEAQAVLALVGDSCDCGHHGQNMAKSA